MMKKQSTLNQNKLNRISRRDSVNKKSKKGINLLILENLRILQMR
jgi:hypothetical protein